MKPPVDFTSGAWVGTLKASAYYRRSQRQIQMWCETGFLDECKVKTYRDIAGRWWIRIGDDISSREKREKREATSLQM